MPLIAHIIFWDPAGKPITSVIKVNDKDDSTLTGSEVWAFEHRVWSNYKKKTWMNSLYDVRKHEPMKITKPLDRLTPILNKYCVIGAFLKKVEIRWYRFKEKSRLLEEYFRITMEHVCISSVCLVMPNIRDKKFERFDPFEQITLCYQKISWLYIQGYRIYTDQWNNFFDEGELKDFNQKEEESDEPPPPEEPFKAFFKNGSFIDSGKGFDFEDTVKIKFLFDTSGKLKKNDERKIFAKLYSKYNGKAQDTGVIKDGWIADDGSFEPQFKLKRNNDYDSDKNRPPDAQVEYYATAECRSLSENAKSESIKLPTNELPKGCIAVSFQDRFGLPIKKAACVLKNSKGNQGDKETDDEGTVIFREMLFDEYTFELTLNGETTTLIIPWAADDIRPHQIIVRTKDSPNQEIGVSE